MRDWLTKKLIALTARLKEAADKAAKTSERRWLETVVPVAEPVEERVPVPRDQLLFALGVASTRARASQLRLRFLQESTDPESQAEIPAVREAALKALADVEAFTIALGESGDMGGDHVGKVMCEIIKARINLGVTP